MSPKILKKSPKMSAEVLLGPYLVFILDIMYECNNMLRSGWDKCILFTDKQGR